MVVVDTGKRQRGIMGLNESTLWQILLRTFLVSCVIASTIGLGFFWGVPAEGASGRLQIRVLGICTVIVIAAALALNATRLRSAPKVEDEDGEPRRGPTDSHG